MYVYVNKNNFGIESIVDSKLDPRDDFIEIEVSKDEISLERINQYLKYENGKIVKKEHSEEEFLQLTMEYRNSPERYAEKRKQEYPPMEEQLDYIYHNGVDAWKTNMIDPIKAKYPKPL